MVERAAELCDTAFDSPRIVQVHRRGNAGPRGG